MTIIWMTRCRPIATSPRLTRRRSIARCRCSHDAVLRRRSTHEPAARCASIEGRRGARAAGANRSRSFTGGLHDQLRRRGHGAVRPDRRLRRCVEPGDEADRRRDARHGSPARRDLSTLAGGHGALSPQGRGVLPRSVRGRAVRPHPRHQRVLRQPGRAQGVLPHPQGRAARAGAGGSAGVDHRDASRAIVDARRPRDRDL